MQKLKNNVLLILTIFSAGCQTSKVFEIKTHLRGGGMDDLQVVSIDSDRIKHECYFMNAEAENNWRHQYFMYILNEKNEAIPVMYPTNQGDEECLAHFKKVEKVFKKEPKVRMCLRGEYIKNIQTSEMHDFGKLGRHLDVYDSMQFDSICNSKECYSINETWTTTCPGFVKHERAEEN
jgi:hypothetical protein